MPPHVSSTSAHHQEVKIILYDLWYHHTCRWPSGAQGTSITLLHFANTATVNKCGLSHVEGTEIIVTEKLELYSL
jgi:hypothetical protein